MKEKIILFVKKNHLKWTIIKLIFLIISFFVFYSYPLFNLDIHNSKEIFLLSILKGLSSVFPIFYLIFIPLFLIEFFLLIILKIEIKKIYITLFVFFLYVVCVSTAYNRYSVYKFHQEFNER